MADTDYIVISPVRNEEKWLPLTIDSVRSQTLLPSRWIIVNDGSTDQTGALARSAAAQCDWILAVERPDRGHREPGGGVVDSFYEGYSRVGAGDWRYLVKLDGDVSFTPDYFARCLACFQKDPKLGIGGGTVCQEQHGRLFPESTVDPAFHVRGATKIYRRECWDQIGGLLRAPGWDTVDEFKANRLGWSTYTFPDIRLRHHRPAGGAQGAWKNWVKNGRANYVAGYHPLFMLFKCCSRALSRPYGIGALGLLTGFVSGYLRKIPQFNDVQTIRYIRQQQVRRMLRQDCLWDQKAGG